LRAALAVPHPLAFGQVTRNQLGINSSVRVQSANALKTDVHVFGFSEML
jgi:hypothetical protein